MRSDMAKVLVERPRIADRFSRKGRRRDFDDLPRHEGMRRPHGYGRSFNDHFEPLRRYLRKQVGRPWSKVYSEICRTGGGLLNQPLRKHVFDFVVIDVAIGPHRRPWHKAWTWAELPANMLYVDPRTRILRQNRPKRRR